MEIILKKKDELNILKNKCEKKLFIIENELIKLQQELVKFNENQLVDSINLSEPQKIIVNAEDKNILVIACPGAGKTHTLISRYTNLILKKDVKPESVLLITFTKKAGQEMLHRLQNIVPTKLPFHTGSLHGLSYRILQKYNNINYTILDEKETHDLLKQECNNILNNIKLNNSLNDSLINSEDKESKNNGKNQSSNIFIDDEVINIIKINIVNIIDQISITYPLNFKNILKKLNLIKYSSIINQIYKTFNKRKKFENAIDFNDLMIQFCEFLKSSKSIEFKNSIKYIFFDEYQDINPIQNYILSMFKNNSNIMVVGDDAQSIYSFRGSSIKYIYNFPNEFIPNNKYFLVENYRSTQSIINTCQNIIDNNLSQYKKNVISAQNEEGIKPSIYAFTTNNKHVTSQEEQYKWIASDILRKLNNGISLASMVILARTNKSLMNIEFELLLNKIPFVKQLGASLLDKYHIKDFLAFIIIINNSKSSIHWKRIISLHKGFSLIKANEIIENQSNIFNKIINLSETNEEMKNLVDVINKINTIKKDVDKAKTILDYLEKLWLLKNRNVDVFKNDVLDLLYNLRNSNLNEFINDLYLNREIDCKYDNVLYLSTVHGAKGLEWEHVYILDVTNHDFPNIKSQYYMDDLETMEEERRLFYVACSRAKKFLIITYYTDKKISMSPFIREFDTNLYLGNNVVKNKIQIENHIQKDITSILRNYGYLNIAPLFANLNIKEKNIHYEFEIPTHISKLKNKFIIGNFFDYLIPKMIQNNYPNKIKKFDLNIIHKNENFPKKIYYEYIDENNHWNNLLENIFFISIYNNLELLNTDIYKTFLLNQNIFYNQLEIGIKKLIDMFKPKKIYNHLNINFDILKAEIDLLFDDILIEMKVTSNEICSLQNLCQIFTYAYLLEKKQKKINKIILYNIENGMIYIIDTSLIDFKLFYEKMFLV